MTMANKITLARVVITPVFFALFQFAAQGFLNVPHFLQITALLLLLLLFIAAELSDLLDGILARHLGQVSGVGKLMDPFSDVFSRITYFFCFYQVGIMPSYAFILILWRELSMLFVRQLIQLYKQGPLPARWAGKVKAVIYFVATILGLLVFLYHYWPGNSFASRSPCLFSLQGEDFRTLPTAFYTILRSWLLPLGFFISVLASWYSFILYLKDFLPTLLHTKPD